MIFVKSGTPTNVIFFMADVNDPTAGKASLTGITLRYMTDAGVYSTAYPTVTEIGDGWYKQSISFSNASGHVIRPMEWRATGAIPFREIIQVLPELPGNLSATTLAAIANYVLNAHVDDAIASGVGDAFTAGEPTLAAAVMERVGEVALNTGTDQLTVYRKDGATVIIQLDKTPAAGATTPYTAQSISA